MANERQAIQQWLDSWLAASSAGDYHAMLPMLADDVVFVVPGAPPFGKKEFQAAYEGPMKGVRMACEAELEECIGSGNIACTRTKLAVSMTMPDGSNSRAKGYTMSVFRRELDGRWLLARDANLLTPEK
jgi:uncharacterized protein (TIGR02246 family)